MMLLIKNLGLQEFIQSRVGIFIHRRPESLFI